MRTHVDSDHGKRSGRTIEPARIDPDNHIGQAGTELVMTQINGIYDSGRWQDACEKCMQPAARVGVMFFGVAVVRMRNRAVTTLICVMVMHMCGRNTAGRRSGKW
jgi:hypothetical protein